MKTDNGVKHISINKKNQWYNEVIAQHMSHFPILNTHKKQPMVSINNLRKKVNLVIKLLLNLKKEIASDYDLPSEGFSKLLEKKEKEYCKDYEYMK